MLGWLRRKFLLGIVALAPLGITAWVVYKVFTAVDTTVTPLITQWIGFRIPGLGFAAIIALILLSGLFASNVVGRTIIGRFEVLFAKVPLFSRIYIAVKQIGEAILTSRETIFDRVVLFEYPRQGSWAIGFVTSEHRGGLEKRTGKQHSHVFVPTTPNPTSGFLLFLPEKDLVDLDMTVEDGLKLVVSGGAVTPDSPHGYVRTDTGERIAPVEAAEAAEARTDR
jgi:uncharacterized membrane protein